MVGIPFFTSRFAVPQFPTEAAFVQLRSSPPAVLPGEQVVNWTRLVISEIALGVVFVATLLSYWFCATSDAEWVALPGIISLLLAIGLGFGMFFTVVGFGVMYFFANDYFVQRRFHAVNSPDYAHFIQRFQPYHEKAVRNFGA